MGIRRSANRDGEQGRRGAAEEVAASAGSDSSKCHADADSKDAAKVHAAGAEEVARRPGVSDRRSSHHRRRSVWRVVVLEAVEWRTAADGSPAAGEEAAGEFQSGCAD